MEEPLITEESSSGGGGGRRTSGGNAHQRLSKSYQRRSDAISYGTRYQKAAALVDLAEDGIGLPEEVLNDQRFDRAAKYYFMYIKFDLLWSVNLFALVLLNFLEKPLWCANSGRYSCQDRNYFFLGELPYLNKAESLIYEGITVLILISHTLFPLAYEGFHLYWKNHLNKLKDFLVLVLICDMLVYALYVSPLVVAYLPFRLAPYIRVAFVALTIRT